MKGPSPLLGYNNNVRHKGRVFHIQTEDSGIRHPHVITHLFMDGGRIVKTLKTSYAQHLEDENGHEHVRALMKQQHQGMFRDLRDGKFDYALAPVGAPPSSASGAPTASQAPASIAPSSLAPRTISEASLAAVSSPTEPHFPAHAEEAAPVTIASRSQTDLAALPVGSVPVPANRVTDPSAQTMPDMRAVRPDAPAPLITQAPRPAVPTERVAAVASAVASEDEQAVSSSDDREPSAGDAAAYDAIEDYDPGLSTTRRRTPPPASDMPPPPLAMLSKARPDGVYRSQATPTPPPPARAAMGSSPGARAGAASRPPVGSPVSPSTRPQSRRSLFGEDYVSEKSLDEVILSYLAEDLDVDK